MKKQLKIPKFKNEDEERDFWSNIDLSEYMELVERATAAVNNPEHQPTLFGEITFVVRRTRQEPPVKRSRISLACSIPIEESPPRPTLYHLETKRISLVQS